MRRSWLQENAHRRTGSGPHKTVKPAHVSVDWREDMYLEKIASVCLLTRTDGRVLAISRGTDLLNLGLPGGKVEPGESRKHAAIRELREETGIIAEMAHTELVYEAMNRDVFVSAFRVSKWKGTLIPAHDEGTPMWVYPEELLTSYCVFREFNYRVMQHAASLLKLR